MLLCVRCFFVVGLWCNTGRPLFALLCIASFSLALAVVVGTADHLAVVHVRTLLATALAVHFAHLIAALQSIATGRRPRLVSVALW